MTPRRLCRLAVPAVLVLSGVSGTALASQQPDPASVLAYWTAQRMAGAQPGSETTAAHIAAPALPVELTAAARPYTDPGERVHGKVFYTKNGQNTWCSASVVTAANKSLVWTAAHCVSGATNVMFVPAYNSAGGDDAPYGRWPALKVATSANDHAVVVVHPLNGQNLQDVVGANGIRFNGPVNGRTTIWGYPAARIWTGRDLTYCNQPTSVSGSSTRTACDSEGGSSGGAYITGASSPTGLGFLWANHTAGQGGTAIGSVFGTTAKNLYDANSGGTPPGGEVVWSDDFESDRGWQANPTNTDTATSGRFERADPQATTYQNTTYQQGTTTSGTNALITGATAGADVGANDLDGGTTSIRSPEITLPAGGTYTLGFQHYLAHLNNATAADYLRIQVLTTTGATTVFTKSGAAANTAATWQNATANLTPYAGQTIRLLIEAADNDTGSLLEAGLDDLKITKG